ncbi:MAG: hypothetical protein GY801_07490 [bacterium]|nr:hypothetical protein [bacterium]
MLLIDIEKEIQPLSRSEKLQLMQYISTILLKEEKAPAADYFEPGASYPVYTPTIAPDDSAFAGALQLQELLEAQS